MLIINAVRAFTFGDALQCITLTSGWPQIIRSSSRQVNSRHQVQGMYQRTAFQCFDLWLKLGHPYVACSPRLLSQRGHCSSSVTATISFCLMLDMPAAWFKLLLLCPSLLCHVVQQQRRPLPHGHLQLQLVKCCSLPEEGFEHPASEVDFDKASRPARRSINVPKNSVLFSNSGSEPWPGSATIAPCSPRSPRPNESSVYESTEAFLFSTVVQANPGTVC